MDDSAQLHLFGWDALAIWRNAALAEARFLQERDMRWQQGVFDDDELPDFCASRLMKRRSPLHEVGEMHAPSEIVFRLCQEYELDLPLDVTVTSRAQRRHGKYVRSHLLLLDNLESQSIVLRRGVYLPLPHIALLQCAKDLDDIGFALLASELLSQYSIDSESGGLLERPPLTSVQAIENFLPQASGLHGVKVVRRMLPYLCERSRSPRETALALAICLPYWQGGYSLPRPQVNGMVPLNKSARKIYGKTSLECDLCWPEKKVAVFYESDAHHNSAAQMIRDSRRNSALAANGYTVLSATNKQLKTLESTNAWMEGLAKSLDRRIRPQAKDYPQKHMALWRRLF